MAEGVVDLLEPVHIDDEQAERSAIPVCTIEFGVDAVEEGAAVEASSETVVGGDDLHLPLARLEGVPVLGGCGDENVERGDEAEPVPGCPAPVVTDRHHSEDGCLSGDDDAAHDQQRVTDPRVDDGQHQQPQQLARRPAVQRDGHDDEDHARSRPGEQEGQLPGSPHDLATEHQHAGADGDDNCHQGVQHAPVRFVGGRHPVDE